VVRCARASHSARSCRVGTEKCIDPAAGATHLARCSCRCRCRRGLPLAPHFGALVLRCGILQDYQPSVATWRTPCCASRECILLISSWLLSGIFYTCNDRYQFKPAQEVVFVVQTGGGNFAEAGEGLRSVAAAS